MAGNIKITRLITWVLGAFWLIFLLVGGGAWWALSDSGKSLRDVHDNHMARSESMAQLALAVEGERLEIMRAFQHDPTSPLVKLHDHPVDSHFKTAQAREAKVVALWKDLQAKALPGEEARAVEEALRLRQAWDAKARQSMDRIKAGDFSVPVMGAFLVAGRTEGAVLMAALEKLRQWHADQAQIKADAAEVQQARAGWAFIGMLLCFGLPATWFSFNVLGRLKQGFAEADAMAAAIAAGDLGVKVHSGGQDEIGHLLSSMERMNGHLVAVISQVRQAADSIGTASSEVAAGNVDLSHRTETTASNLQQTASSTEQLGATVRQNAGHAKQASELANGASGVATHGGEVVSQVVATMREINESSKQIAEITGVIDGIAFQTNILALNAAVEAARAGEQGRGFAVVAAEVRSLAQRSAEAARQIKTLIQASVDRVEAGSRQADDAGHTMAEVVEAIKRVSEIVAEISQASREQSEGVALVGQAVSQMDQATQQNAALVEQSAAAAESLSAQAQQLVQAVAAFKLAKHD